MLFSAKNVLINYVKCGMIIKVGLIWEIETFLLSMAFLTCE